MDKATVSKALANAMSKATAPSYDIRRVIEEMAKELKLDNAMWDLVEDEIWKDLIRQDIAGRSQ